jgi:hypothetical protein
VRDVKYWEIIADKLTGARRKNRSPRRRRSPGPRASGEADYVAVVSNTDCQVAVWRAAFRRIKKWNLSYLAIKRLVTRSHLGQPQSGRVIQEQIATSIGPEPWFVTKISNSTQLAEFQNDDGSTNRLQIKCAKAKRIRAKTKTGASVGKLTGVSDFLANNPSRRGKVKKLQNQSAAVPRLI